MNEDEIKKRLAENIKILRVKQKLTQDDLSQLCGITQPYLNKIENEKVNPSLFILLKLTNALKVTMNDLLY